ncbi:MAG: MFS transporter [Acidobacteria bacterium]|nr:MFS transporter [Acidobacteriota bacterium]
MGLPPLATGHSEITESKPVAEDGAAARHALIRLCAAGFVAYCSYAICRTPLLPLFARELGAGPSVIGLVMGASTLTGVVVKLPAGALSDIVGRRSLLLAGALVFATLPFTYLAASTLLVVILLRFAHGSATAIFGPVASASVSDIAPRGSVAPGSARTPRRRAQGRRWGRYWRATWSPLAGSIWRSPPRA